MAALEGLHGLQSAQDAFAVTPDDANDIAVESRWLVAAVAGTVKVTMKNGATPTLPIGAGIPLPVRVTRVWSTGTTATGIAVLV